MTGNNPDSKAQKASKAIVDDFIDKKLDPNDLLPHDFIGVEAALNTVLEDDPENPVFNAIKADFLLAPQRPEADYEGALPRLRKAIAADPENDDLISALAISLYKTGAFAEATPHLERLAAKYPGDSLVVMQLSYIRFQADDHESARDLFEKVLPYLEDLTPAFADEIEAMTKAGLREPRSKDPNLAF